MIRYHNQNSYRYGSRSRVSGRRRRTRLIIIKRIVVSIFCTGLAAAGLAGGSFFLSNAANAGGQAALAIRSGGTAEAAEEEPESQSEAGEAVIVIETRIEPLLEEAALLAAGYNYDQAIELLQSDAALAQDAAVQAAVTEYEGIKESLVAVNPQEVTHIFFHSLIMDNQKAFDSDYKAAGYNQVMTTGNEFIKMMEAMYDKGYVLVRLHDIAGETIGEDGNTVMKPGNIMLPPGKKAFVISQDDVNYYEYMEGDGFARRIVAGEDGKPACEMLMDDGSISVGAYDLVPLLENFIQEHPDFSYQGARAVLALTGYEGILGYRTAGSYADSPTYEQDCEDAARVARCLKDNGWELASHSWGHPDLGAVSYERFKADSDKWEKEVEPLIGPTDIIIYPFGADVGDWRPYAEDNERFQYLYSLGFRYFCNVDSNPYWVQLEDRYLRQGRRNLDGYRMWKDITAEEQGRRKLDDLFRAEDIFDGDRPTPVAEM